MHYVALALAENNQIILMKMLADRSILPCADIHYARRNV